MESMGIIGFVFGLTALSFTIMGKEKFDALKKEFDELKKKLEDSGTLDKK